MEPAAEQRLEHLLNTLREQGCRITPQRIALLRLLLQSEEHLSATQIHERLLEKFPTMSLATVYKTLSLLKEMGEVLELGFSGAETRYDGQSPHPHPHLICVQCRKVLDPDVPAFDALAQDIAARSGFHIVSHRLDFFGICPTCQTDAPPAA